MGDFEERCSKIKLIVSEMDGIITEHISPIDELGNTLFKQYYMKDFEAINELKKTFTFAFLAVDNTVNYNLCRAKNIPFYWARSNKRSELQRIMHKYKATSPEEVLYIGCSFSDIHCVQLIPFSLCPSDAINDLKHLCYHQLTMFGGGGVLCEVYDLLKSETNRRKLLDK